MVKDNSKKSNSSFEIVSGNLNDLKKSLEGADVVYSRNWMSPKRYDLGKDKEIEMANQHKDWISSKELMKLTNDAYFIHPMPVARGNEVEDEVASSKNSIIYTSNVYRSSTSALANATTLWCRAQNRLFA